jgi:superfamily II DNA or RNA helicase
MNNQIYIFHPLIYPYFKIGSTQDYIKRISNYITISPYFDNKSHKLWVYDIIKSKYNCYQLDYIINKLCSLYSYPYKKFSDSGGTEFYYADTQIKLSEFFTKLGIIFNCKQIDIDEIRIKIKLYSNDELKENKEFIENDYNELNIKSVSNTELREIEKKLNLNTFELKNYQNTFRNAVKNYTSRLTHIIVSPTGTGKTVAFTSIISDDIIKNKKHVIVITKKKEILHQMSNRINNYIKLFNENNIVKQFDYAVNDLLHNCSTKILNDNYQKPQIFIINWDKFTSSKKTDYKKIKWSNFSLIVIDESHWVGSNKIYDMMIWIKNNTNLNYIGFSATPVRLNRINQTKTLQIFGDNDNFDILSEYSYYSALIDKAICPIKYMPIEISYIDLIDDINDDDDENSDDEDTKNIIYKVLSPNTFEKIWSQIEKNIISKLHFKKGIIWFRTRIDMLRFYNKMKNKINNYKLFPTMSIKSNENKQMKNLIKQSELCENDFKLAIDNFEKQNNNSILLSIMRATEGFDDDKTEFGIRLYHSNIIDPLNESQRMGRFNRWYKNNPKEIKQFGYYASLEISDNKEEIKKSLIQRFKSWIIFAKTYSSISKFDKIQKTKDEEKEIKKIIELYIDSDLLKTHEIDIQKDIIDSYKNNNFDKYKIKNELKIYNSKQENKNNIINTKSLYDSWAFQNNFLLSDEIEENKLFDFNWLFDIKNNDYLTFEEFKKLCKNYKDKYNELPIGILYSKLIQQNTNIPKEPEQFYKNKFSNLIELFK